MYSSYSRKFFPKRRVWDENEGKFTKRKTVQPIVHQKLCISIQQLLSFHSPCISRGFHLLPQKVSLPFSFCIFIGQLLPKLFKFIFFNSLWATLFLVLLLEISDFSWSFFFFFFLYMPVDGPRLRFFRTLSRIDSKAKTNWVLIFKLLGS